MIRADAPPLLIDASNVCRDRRLAPRNTEASWSRLESLVTAVTTSAIPFSRVYVVADRSLHYALDRTGQLALRQMERAGDAEQRRFADERIVELAFSPSSELCGAVVVTQDYFDDFRRTYPEIELEAQRVVRWTSDSSGSPIPELGDFGSRTHRRVSRKEEDGELAQRRLRRRDVQNRAVATYFRCTQKGCLVAQLWPDRLQELPKYDDAEDAFVCPRCDTLLEQGDARRPAVQVIVFLDGLEKCRLLLEEGMPLDVGRVDSGGCIGLERFLPADRLEAVSRRHLHMELSRTVVTVADLHSKNGVFLEGRRSEAGGATRLGSGEIQPWALRDAVRLPSGITLERSGRRLPVTGEQRPETGETSPRVAPTTFASSDDQR